MIRIVEQHLQSKKSSVPDDGGEDCIIVTDHLAAIIDGATAKTPSRYVYDGKEAAPGKIASGICRQSILMLDPQMEALPACQFINEQIYQAYVRYGILDKARKYPNERFAASFVLYNQIKNYVVFAGDCQGIVNDKYYQKSKTVDNLNAEARSAELDRLLKSGEITLAQLALMPIDEEPGRKWILSPPEGSGFPGLVGQSLHQNNPDSELGFYANDGFPEFSLEGFEVIKVPHGTSQIILTSDGYPVAPGQDPVKTLSSLEMAEENLKDIKEKDPFCLSLYKSTKGMGNLESFDDRAYLKISIAR